VDRDDELIADWTELLTVEGETPPPPLVARCAATFGASPDLVLCQAIHDHGTRWKVAVLTAGLFGCGEARSAHPHWDSQAYVHQLGHDDGATYDCWAVSVREITSVGTLPHEDDGRHWRRVGEDEGGGLLTSWRVYLRDGHHVDLPYGELPTDLAAHERAEEIAVALLKVLAV
jgi:hypothetical protein